MDTIYMNSENSRTSEYHVLVLKLTDNFLSIYYTWRNVKNSYKNNKFKISAPTWSYEFEHIHIHRAR